MHFEKLTPILILFLIFPLLSFSQQPEDISVDQTDKSLALDIIVSDNVRINEPILNEQFIEPHISAHPTDPNHIVAVGWVWSTFSDRNAEVARCSAFLSKDGGLTWDRNDLSGSFCADPWVTVTENRAVITALDMSTSNQLFTYFSLDGGRSWEENPQSLGYFHDGPRSTLNKDGSVYITSHQSKTDADNIRRTAIYVGKSIRPNRQNYTYVEKMSNVFPSNLNLAINGITTLSDGTLAIIYQDFQRHVKGPQRDEDGNWRGVLSKRRDWLITSKDQGKTFTFPKMITENCYDRSNDLATDTSKGKFDGNLYSACGGDEGTSILFMYSKSEYKGDYWTDATPIEDPDTLKGERRDPHIAVNKDGIVAVVWLDNRDDPGKCVSPYITVSADGGETFKKPVRVGDELSCPVTDKAGEHVAESSRWSWGGDYFGFTAAADGRFHILWPDARSGKFELYTAAIEVQTD